MNIKQARIFILLADFKPTHTKPLPKLKGSGFVWVG